MDASSDFAAELPEVLAAVALAVSGGIPAPAMGGAAGEESVGIALVVVGVAVGVASHVRAPSLLPEAHFEALAGARDGATRRFLLAREDVAAG